MHLDTIESIEQDTSNSERPVLNFGRCLSSRESALRDFRSSIPLLVGDLFAVWGSWSVTRIIASTAIADSSMPGINSAFAISVAFVISLYCLGLYPGVLIHPSEETE